MKRPKSQSKIEDRRKGARGDRNLPQGKGAETREDVIFTPQSRYNEYTPLTSKRETILKEVYNTQLIQSPS